MTKALITGITGQDGGYLAEQLVAGGSSVHGTIRKGEVVPSHLAALGDAVALHEADVRDGSAIPRLLLDIQPDEIYNLAGLSSVVESWQQPVETAQTNAVAVAVILDTIKQLQEQRGCSVRFLQASSGEVFAGSGCRRQTEETPITPMSPYGAAKAYAHQLVCVYRQVGIHGVNVVLYNHESPRRPPQFVTRKITSTVAAIARGHAKQLTLGNLDSKRDWGWAPEYVDAMIRAIRHPDPQDFVIATGLSHSVRDFVSSAFAQVGIDDWERYVHSDAAYSRTVDRVDMVGDASKAKRLLNWSPRVTFAEVVERMVAADLATLGDSRGS